MKIVIVGSGAGDLESRVGSLFSRQGHEVVAVSRPSGIRARTGTDLADVLRGTAAVLEISDPPSFQDAATIEVLTAFTRSLLAREAAASVPHHVLLSDAGAGMQDAGYFRARSAHEALVAESAIPYSILRATPCFEFLGAIADAATHGGVVRVPPAHIQPIAADDVARALSRVATGRPLNATLELGGPESFYLDGLLRRILGARRDPREVITDRHAGYFGAAIGDRALVASEEAELGQIRFEQWLACTSHESLAPQATAPPDPDRPALGQHEFRVDAVPPGSVLLLGDVAVFSVEGGFCATQATCTHRHGPLSEGAVDGSTVTCPLHGARFNVWTGAVLSGPATAPLKTYAVVLDGDIGRVHVPVGDTA
jgi:uncharacterized protein YbjT (DUF2867 family)/nitrite reductase/ring-hydroxylating ferredoxin subunit